MINFSQDIHVDFDAPYFSWNTVNKEVDSGLSTAADLSYLKKERRPIKKFSRLKDFEIHERWTPLLKKFPVRLYNLPLFFEGYIYYQICFRVKFIIFMTAPVTAFFYNMLIFLGFMSFFIWVIIIRFCLKPEPQEYIGNVRIKIHQLCSMVAYISVKNSRIKL